MSDREPDSSQPPSTPTTQDPPVAPRTLHWSVIAIPAAALLVGLLIGGLVVGAGNDNDDSSPQATQTITVSPTANPSEDTTIVVPKECLQAADTVQEATQLLKDNITAIQEFKAQQIIDMLNELEDLTNQANEQAQACSETTIAPTPDTPTATP